MRRLLVVLVTLTVLGAGGLAFAVSGLFPIGALEGHWRITQWMLEFGQRRAVATHALAIDVPPLDDPALTLRGAGHFETACRRCHSVPGGQAPVLLQHMLPPPPDLRMVSTRFSAAELFFIVKHGLKFTGMPGWPVDGRDDEVWAMVAFLRALPGTTPEEYERLVYGDRPVNVLVEAGAASAPAPVATTCGRCHGSDGLGRGEGAFPKLAGQRVEYLYQSLRAYAYGSRRSGIMIPIAADLTDDAMRTLAEYYSGLPGLPSADDALTGRTIHPIAAEGLPERGVPACAQCHGPRAGPRNATYPTLAGQYPRYLALQLRVFKDRNRGGTPYSHLMHPAADHLSEEQVREITDFYGGLTVQAPQ